MRTKTKAKRTKKARIKKHPILKYLPEGEHSLFIGVVYFEISTGQSNLHILNLFIDHPHPLASTIKFKRAVLKEIKRVRKFYNKS